MAYADKCFYFDWGNREIKLEDFDIYDSISVRRRDLWDEEREESNHNVSIELWVKDDERDKHEDREIVLSRDNAMALATKLIRAVAELDADDYTEDLRQDVALLKELAGDKFDEAIVKFIKKRHNVMIGERTAEEIWQHNDLYYP